MIATHHFRLSKQQVLRFVLAAFWLAGLLFGITAARSAENILPSLMRRLYMNPVSIVSLLIRVIISYLITIISLIISKPQLQLLGALTESFCLSYWLTAIILTWESPFALGICLLFGSSFLSSSCLLWFWYRHIEKFHTYIWRDLLLCISLHSIATLAELYVFRISLI